MSELQIIYRTALHRLKIKRFVYKTPVNYLSEIFTQHHVKPYSCRTAVALHEWMGYVHLHIFGDNLLKSFLGHFLDSGKSLLEIKRVGETEAPFADVYGAYFSCKIVETAENPAVYELQAARSACFKFIYCSRVE